MPQRMAHSRSAINSSKVSWFIYPLLNDLKGACHLADYRRNLGAKSLRFLASLAVVLLTTGCWLLPSNFESLPLDKKIDAYVRHFAYHGAPDGFARSRISWHGWEAADIMAKYLTRQRRGLPNSEAIDIIHAVQLRGCSLRGSAAEHALEWFLAREPQETAEHFAAKVALESIRRDVKLGTMRYDDLRGGPCESQIQPR
jgi:hypothetical protein